MTYILSFVGHFSVGTGCDMWKLHHDVLPLDVSIVMENYTTISSWACSWGCSQSCRLFTYKYCVMEQYIVIL